MDRIRVDCSRIVRLDVERYKQRVTGGPPHSPAGPATAGALTTALSAASYVSSTAALLKEITDLGSAAGRIPLSFLGGSGPMFAPPARSPFVTVGAGSSASIFAVIGVSFGSGVYGSNTPEIGLYSSAGGGYWTNYGVSGSIQLTYVIGPPSAFGGMSWSVGVDCDIPGVGLGVSAAVIFSASGPPYQFLGWSVGVGAGVSVLPVDFTFQVSNTKLIPL